MHVVVTGASSGIGEALAREWLARDARVTLVARRRDLLDKIASSARSGRTHVVQADLADPAAGFAWIDEAERVLGPIDVLVNNAGVQIVKEVADTEWSDGERLLLLDLNVPMRLTMIMLKRMIARGEGGAIVDVSSAAALGPTPGMFFYNAAKAGLAAASEALRAEVKKHKIHVVTVYPGPVTSAMEAAGRAAYVDSWGQKHAPKGEPDVLARMVADAVEKKRARVIYPRVYTFARWFPTFARWFMDVFTPPLKKD
jgi:short-subunit dehydrogenase